MSGLFGTSARLPKDSQIYDTLGSLDEINSWVGVCRAQVAEDVPDVFLEKELFRVQEALFIIQAECAGADKRIEATAVTTLEEVISAIEDSVGNPHAFVVPGATKISAVLDYARTVARRAERSLVSLAKEHSISNESLAYMNRLSSLFYALARYASKEGKAKESSPSYST